MKLLRFVIVALCYLFLFCSQSYADTNQNIKIQSYLNALGYNVGKTDGIIGKNTRKQLIKALVENGYKFDGQANSNEVQILKKIAKNKNIELNERLIGISRYNLKQIMDTQTSTLFVPSDRNTASVDGFEIVDFKGRKAATGKPQKFKMREIMLNEA